MLLLYEQKVNDIILPRSYVQHRKRLGQNQRVKPLCPSLFLQISLNLEWKGIGNGSVTG